MASYKGFVRLPPIGELGLSRLSGDDDNSPVGTDQEKVINMHPSEIATASALQKETEIVSCKAEAQNQSDSKELKKASPRHKKSANLKNWKIQRKHEKSLDEKQLVQRPEIHNRDSGLEIDSGTDNMENTPNYAQNIKISHKKRVKDVKFLSSKTLSLTSETKLDILNENDIKNREHQIVLRGPLGDLSNKDGCLPVSDNYSNLELQATQAVTFSQPSNQMDIREMAIRMANNYSRPECPKKQRKFVDYVLVFESDDVGELFEEERQKFENALINEGIDVMRTKIGMHIYVELCCSFKRLCEEAESIFLQMPLLGQSLHKDESVSRSIWASFKSEREVDDICIPFCTAKKEIYDGINNPDRFFRPSLRSLLVHQILKEIKMKDTDETEHHNVEVLASLLHSGVYKDAFILHERSSLDPNFPWNPHRKKTIDYPCELNSNEALDRRKELHDTWLASFKFQPLWKVRNYFGEKIALYFAWLGLLSTSLWPPMFIGLIVFIYGIIYVFIYNKKQSWSRVAFDNDLTPGFALMICLWGTVFLEVWKRKNAELAYKWDVDDFEEQEPNRPQFYGTKMVLNPVTGLLEPYYSSLKKTLKSMGSMVLILFMVILVVGSMISVIIYRIIARVDWFKNPYKTLKSNITSSILNSCSIMLLGYVYKTLADKLTEWENHRTQTEFEDSLILKLFGFQFVNSYSTLYYIAFFRERTKSGILGKGQSYTDACGKSNDCMSLLSLQVCMLMLMKPLPKFGTDIVIPLMQKALRSVKHRLKRNRILDGGPVVNENIDSDVEFEEYLEHERKKPTVGNFTLSEYTEKVIQYGYLMLFAAAFPLAPLIALSTNLIDLRIDARRLLWLNRRPISFRAQDIGMWYTILTLLNYIGVITNAFIIAVTSSFGRKYQTKTIVNMQVYNTTFDPVTGNSTTIYSSTQTTITTSNHLWIIIIFQNVVFAVKFILSTAIPDIPQKVLEAQKNERYKIEKVLKSVGLRRGKKKTIASAVANEAPENELQMNANSWQRTVSLKEKMRKLSRDQRKTRRKKRNNEGNSIKPGTYYIDVDENKSRAGESEV